MRRTDDELDHSLPRPLAARLVKYFLYLVTVDHADLLTYRRRAVVVLNDSSDLRADVDHVGRGLLPRTPGNFLPEVLHRRVQRAAELGELVVAQHQRHVEGSKVIDSNR